MADAAGQSAELLGVGSGHQKQQADIANGKPQVVASQCTTHEAPLFPVRAGTNFACNNNDYLSRYGNVGTLSKKVQVSLVVRPVVRQKKCAGWCLGEKVRCQRTRSSWIRSRRTGLPAALRGTRPAVGGVSPGRGE